MKKLRSIWKSTLISTLICACSSAPVGSNVKPASLDHQASNQYSQVNLVANRAEFKPEILEPLMQNAWGLANRPAGFGGHFWVTANKTGVSLEYVGDVGGKKLFQDNVKEVYLHEPNKKLSTPTGVVFNPAKNFVIEQPSNEGKFTAESKFIFATDSGEIHGWAEKQRSDGTINRPSDGVIKVNNKKRGDQYFGLAIDSKGENLFAADFGTKPQIRIFDKNFREQSNKGKFTNPFIKGRYSKAGEFAPYNIQVIQQSGHDRVFAAFAEIEKDPKTGKLEAGEEQKGAGLGRVVEYDLDGKMVRIWNDKGMLNAPWGFAWAPTTGFGKFSGALLVGNFGDGTIVAFDPATFEAIDYLRKEDGTPIAIDGIWGLLFGNGASLGETNQLYFAAGPNDETDGIFGKIKWNGN